MQDFLRACFCAVGLCLSGCSDTPEFPSHALEATGDAETALAPDGETLIELPGSVPKVSIHLSPEDFASLDRSPYRAEDVSGRFADDEGNTFDPISLNFRGAYALKQMLESGSARNWKLKFPKDNKYRDRREWNLNYEPHLRHKLAYDLMHFAGVPASQPQHVILSVNGRNHGLYLQFEDPDNKGWLKTYFSDHDGDLYKVGYDLPDDVRNRRFGELTHLGPDETAYRNSYNKKMSRTGVPKKDLSTIISFTKELNGIPDEQIPAFFEAKVDLDALISYLVVANFIVHWDGYPGRPKNYWIYQNPSTEKWSIIPWDMDAVFQDPWVWHGQRGSNVSIFAQFDEQIPYRRFGDEGTRRPLVRRLMKHQEYRDRYVARYKELTKTVLNESFLLHHIEALTSLIQASAGRRDIKSVQRDNARIAWFIQARSQHVQSELSGY